MQPQVYKNLTQEQFGLVAAEADKESGLKLDGNTGTATGDGVTVTWAYDPAEMTLTLNCVKKTGLARFASDATVIKHLNTLVAAGSPPAAK